MGIKYLNWEELEKLKIKPDNSFYADNQLYYDVRNEQLYKPMRPSKIIMKPKLRKVIFNPPATIAFWADDTKTVVKCMAGDIYDPYAGLALCYSKKILGEDFHKTFREHCESYYKELDNEGVTISGTIDDETLSWLSKYWGVKNETY